MTISLFAQTQPPPLPVIEPGVSQTLARWRAAHYSDVRYKLNVTLEKGAPAMKGTLEIRVNLRPNGRGEAARAGENAAGSSQILDSMPSIVLDWRKIRGKENLSTVSGVSVNGASVELNPDAKQLRAIAPGKNRRNYFEIDEHLVFADFVKTGENVIKLDFTSPVAASGAAVTRYVDKEDGAEYVYSLFVPSDASTAFPVFDQPDLKARFSLSVKAPANWKVISNTLRKEIQNLTPSHGEDWKKNLATVDFEETKPISTYVFAFAAGDFTEFQEAPTGRNIKGEDKYLIVKDYKPENLGTDNVSSIYLRKSQAEKFRQHAAETFRLNREAVKYLETYFDYKFPFPKYDLVLIPEFPFGGMEHAGATFLRESSVIFPSEPTANDYISRANLIFHEAAHQWFGDTVTMKWFDDLWLKEGFAEFMAYKTLEKVMPEYNAWKAFYERNKPLAYLTDATQGTTPIYQQIPNLSAAKSAYGNIVYRKAPSFLRQAEFYLGEDKFQTAVRAFLKKHQFANAEWADLVKEFITATRPFISSAGIHSNPEIPYDVRKWADAWIKKPGMPVIRIYPFLNEGDYEMIVFKNENNHPYRLGYKQISSLGNDAEWIQKILFLRVLENGDKQKQVFRGVIDTSRATKVDVRDKVIAEDQPPLKRRGQTSGNPQTVLVFPNYQDYGYGIFLLDEKSRAYVLENIQNEKDAFLRSMMWGSLWDSVREAELNPKDYVELAIKNVSVETDELTIQTILARVSTAMNYYLSEKQRDELAPALENLLIEKILAAPTLGQRITFYRAFLNVAASEKARTILKDVLSGKFVIRDLKLKTKDRFDILTRLAVLGDRDAPKLLADLAKTETSDDARRYAYAAGAGFGTKEAKEKYFGDFLNNKEISESWIEAAFAPFNSARHAELTLPYLEKALAELPNLKRTRKIFFVNGWLGAFIGGQKDEKALAIVNKFLTDNPNLDRDLRLKILENADALERAVKIRAKYGE